MVFASGFFYCIINQGELLVVPIWMSSVITQEHSMNYHTYLIKHYCEINISSEENTRQRERGRDKEWHIAILSVWCK